VKVKKDTTVKQVKYSSHPAWPYVLLIATPLLAWPLSQYLHVSPFITPFLILLLWLPFIIMEYVRRCRAAQQEKKSLQAKFDAQDSALFGGKLNSH
jgi:hypothetical protein